MVLENLNKLYVGCSGENLNRYDFTRSDMDGLDCIIETLMDTSGYYRFGDGHISIFNIDKSNLKEHLRTPSMARKFLQNLPTNSPKEFRQALLDCWLDRSIFLIVGNGGRKKTGKEHSECMQELVTENFDKVPTFFDDRKCEACGQLESETNKLLKCPCLAGEFLIFNILFLINSESSCLICAVIIAQKFVTAQRFARRLISKRIKSIVPTF